MADPEKMAALTMIRVNLGKPVASDSDGAVASQACTLATGLATGINGALATDGVATFDVKITHRSAIAATPGLSRAANKAGTSCHGVKAIPTGLTVSAPSMCWACSTVSSWQENPDRRACRKMMDSRSAAFFAVTGFFFQIGANASRISRWWISLIRRFPIFGMMWMRIGLNQRPRSPSPRRLDLRASKASAAASANVGSARLRSAFASSASRIRSLIGSRPSRRTAAHRSRSRRAAERLTTSTDPSPISRF